MLLTAEAPARHPEDRVVVGLPGTRTYRGLTDKPVLVITRVEDTRRVSARVNADAAHIGGAVDRAVTSGTSQIWLRDRGRLWRRLGRAPVDLELGLARAAADRGVPFLGWTGPARHTTAASDAYEEVWSAERRSGLPGADRQGE